MADTAIACWESKYHYKLWRPITAIRSNSTANPGAVRSENWTHLGAPVSNGKGIDELLEERNNGKIYSLAENHSKIVDIYSQIDKIPSDLNNDSTVIFLSAGGNDILSFYVDQQEDITNDTALNPMFSAYKKLIESIQTKMDKAKIVFLDIYYQDNIKYKQFHPIISEWNKKIYEYADKNNYKVLKISNNLTETTDFTMGIEPSSTGGAKIVDLILNK